MSIVSTAIFRRHAARVLKYVEKKKSILNLLVPHSTLKGLTVILKKKLLLNETLLNNLFENILINRMEDISKILRYLMKLLIENISKITA